MRIIAGSKRGMKLLSPRGLGTRPVTDRIKESLFNVLYKYDIIENAVTADLFCGTGSMGLETLSRGASWSTFIDNDHSAVSILEKNIARASFTAQSKTICADVFKIGAPTDGNRRRYNLVFVDPPYALSQDCSGHSPLGKLLILLCDQLDENGIVVIRTSEQTTPLDCYGRLGLIDRRRWGSMTITLLRMDS